MLVRCRFWIQDLGQGPSFCIANRLPGSPLSHGSPSQPLPWFTCPSRLCPDLTSSQLTAAPVLTEDPLGPSLCSCNVYDLEEQRRGLGKSQTTFLYQAWNFTLSPGSTWISLQCNHQFRMLTWAPSGTEWDIEPGRQIQIQRRTQFLLRTPPGTTAGTTTKGKQPKRPTVSRAQASLCQRQYLVHWTSWQRGIHPVSRAQCQAHPRVRKTSTQTTPCWHFLLAFSSGRLPVAHPVSQNAARMLEGFRDEMARPQWGRYPTLRLSGLPS